jgi:hypothetical protein
MKKFFDKLSTLGCMLPFIIGGLFPIVMMFIGIWKACNGNMRMFIINLLSLPFAIIGGVNLVRGFCAVLEEDEQKFDYKKNWKLSIYLLITMAGYFAIALAIVQYVKWNR